MASDAPVTESPTVNVVGSKGEVVRVAPTMRTIAFPVANTRVVDVWVMPRGMHMAILEGAGGNYLFVLAYVDQPVRDLCMRTHVHESLAVDVWHVQPLPKVTGSAQARTLMRHVAHAAADGTVDFEPIRPGQRALWETAVASLEAVLTRPEPLRVPTRPVRDNPQA